MATLTNPKRAHDPHHHSFALLWMSGGLKKFGLSKHPFPTSRRKISTLSAGRSCYHLFCQSTITNTETPASFR